MKNLTIEQQKEFEKMKAKINWIHKKNNDLIKRDNKEVRGQHNIRKNIMEEIDNIKK